MGVVVWKTRNALIIATAAHCLPNNWEKMYLTRKVYNPPQWIFNIMRQKFVDIINPTALFQKDLQFESIPYVRSYRSKNINEDLWFIIAENTIESIKPINIQSIIWNHHSLSFAIRNTNIKESKINLRSWSISFQPKWISNSIYLTDWTLEFTQTSYKNNSNAIPYYEWKFYWSHEDYQNNEKLNWQSWSPVFLCEKLFWIHTSSSKWKSYILCWNVIQQRLWKIFDLVQNQ